MDSFLFRERQRPRALLFSSSLEGRGTRRLDLSELKPAQALCASFFPHREPSPVLFARLDQRPSASASDMVSFGGSKEDPVDNSMSLVASDTEELTGPAKDPTPLPSLEPIDVRAGMDADLFRVLSRAIEELGLELFG